MNKVSLDPRVNRMNLPETENPKNTVDNFDHWQTYEVFTQKKRGLQHVHAGIVHAADAEMALVLAKEQYARRGECVNIWVVKSADITATQYTDSDIFDSTLSKVHREAGVYKVKDKISAFLEQKKQNV